METDPSPQVRSTTGRRIIWPTRLLNIGLIDGFEHSFNDWDVLTQEKLILWPFLAPLEDFPAVFFHISHWYLSWNN